MREGNFSFTSQGRASVCITAQLYDRRALDATSPLPLSSSLTHLTYLTSTSPRIREILIVDGGLECLVRMLLDFCSRPPPPINPRHFYGLLPPGQKLHHPPPVSGRWQPFDRAAAHRFSLAFQCVVNIGVRGSESIRSRVVQAGMLSVVGSVLEQWLLSKGFAVGPSSTGSGAPRESRHVRHARRQEEQERRQREASTRQAAELVRALERRQEPQSSADEAYGNTGPSTEEDDEEMGDAQPHHQQTAPLSREALPPRPSSSSSDLLSTQSSTSNTPLRSSTPNESEARSRSGTVRARPTSAPHTSTSRAGPSSRRAGGHRRPRRTGETDVDDTEGDEAEESHATNLHPPSTAQAVAVVGDSVIDIFDSGGGMGDFQDINGVGAVDRAMVNLEENDALAMGAPPGAPGATNTQAATPRASVTEVTPRPTIPALNDDSSAMDLSNALDGVGGAGGARVILQNLAAGGGTTHVLGNLQAQETLNGGTGAGDAIVRTIMAQSPELRHHSTPNRSLSTTLQQGPFQDEDVLLSLQLLAYLSKYPYVRQAFYQSRHTGASIDQPGTQGEDNTRSPNIFSLVERFTFRPSPSEPHLPRLPTEIQYWAGVIMRNACRKDESHGGIRQCASMTCGKWEKYPREFAKCRRCRKAKYCGKDCQSRAWAEGHRFWCNVKEPDEENAGHVPPGSSAPGDGDAGSGPGVRPPRAPQEAGATGTRRPGVPTVLPLAPRPRATPGPEPPAPPTTVPGTALVTQRHHHHHHHHRHHQPQSRPFPPSLSTPPANSSTTPPTSAPDTLGRNQPAPPITLQLQIPLQHSNSTYRYSGSSVAHNPGSPRVNSRSSGLRGPRRPGTPVGGSPSGPQSAPPVWPPYDIDDEVPTTQRSILTSASPIRPLNTDGRSPPASATTPRRLLSDAVTIRPLSFPRITASVRASPQPVGQEANSGEVGGSVQGISRSPTGPLQSQARSSPMRREIGGSLNLPADEDTVMG